MDKRDDFCWVNVLVRMLEKREFVNKFVEVVQMEFQ